MFSNLDSLLGGAWKISPRGKPSATKEPLQYPLPVKPPLPANLTLPARPQTTFRTKPKASRNANGGVSELDAKFNRSKNSSASIGATGFHYERDPSATHAQEEYKKEDAEPKRSMTSNKSNAQAIEHPLPPRAEIGGSQPSTPSLGVIKPREQLKEIESVDGAIESTISPPGRKEMIVQLKGAVRAPKQKPQKDVATQPAEQNNRGSNTSTSAEPLCGAEIIRLKDTLHALYHPDPTGTIRRAALIAEHDAKVKQSSLRRDEEIKAAKTKHLSYAKDLDDELESDLRELDSGFKDKQKAQGKFESTLEDLNALTTNQGRKFNTSDFAPKLTLPSRIPAATSEEAATKKPFVPFRLPSRPPREPSEEFASQNSQTSVTTVASPSPPTISGSIPFDRAFSPSLFVTPNHEEHTPKMAERSASTSFNGEIDLSQMLTNTETSKYSTSEPSPIPLKRKYQHSPSTPSKKARTNSSTYTSTAAPPANIPSYIETDPIRPKLTPYPFCFVSAWNVDIKDENLKLMRKMVEHFNFYPEAVRADKTGYFLIFESSEEGDRMAADCAKHFKKWKFRKQHMYMSFLARGCAVDGA